MNQEDQKIPDVDLDLCLSSYDYQLPADLIAQNPAVPRDSSRLLIVDSPETGRNKLPLHHVFRDLPNFLQPGDLLVMNNTKVIPARLYGSKTTGAEVEALLLEECGHNCWLALVKPGKRFKIGSEIIFRGAGNREDRILRAEVVDSDEDTGGRLLRFDLPLDVSLMQVLADFGEIPLPPYITASSAADEQYQTVYAQEEGAIAAPTAGLHFTPDLLEKLTNSGIKQAFVTLHVGVGTFRPVEVENVTTHNMHEEWIEVPRETVDMIQATQAKGGRVIAVGTTVVRALEGAAELGDLRPFVGKTNLFIYPGYKWRVVDGLITNFHLPKSSLLMLVSALIGRERLLNIYETAMTCKYRFYSFGDAMLILPTAKEQFT